MKQSLEKLHRGMITPEVQQESDPAADTLTDQWRTYGNPFTEPLTNSGHRDIGVHKGSKSWMGDGAQLSDINIGIDLGSF